MYIFTILDLQILLFCVAHYKEFCNKFFILVGYIIDYVHIYCHNVLKHINMFKKKLNERIT
jgi:hypothetical protein